MPENTREPNLSELVCAHIKSPFGRGHGDALETTTPYKRAQSVLSTAPALRTSLTDNPLIQTPLTVYIQDRVQGGEEKSPGSQRESMGRLG